MNNNRVVRVVIVEILLWQTRNIEKGLRWVVNQPAAAQIGGGKLELFFQEGAKGFGSR
jgi:hypothetical protein